jgi:outer membrane protein TolC
MPVTFRLPNRMLLLGACALAGACTHGRPAPPLDPVALSVALSGAPSPAPAGPLAYEDAVRRAVAGSPELAAARKAVEGVNLWPAREPLGLSMGDDSDGRVAAGLEIDALSLLGLGPIRAERCLARARRDEATIAWHARTREVAGEIAEAYAVEGALREAPAPPAFLDAEAYVRAGLAPAASTSAAEAARISIAADEVSREAERRAQRLRVGRHLGLTPEGAPVLLVTAAPWPDVPPADAARLLAVDPEVQRRLAAHEVARAEVARAHMGRYPSLVLSPSLAFDPRYFFGAVGVRIPLGAGAQVRAAVARLESARLSVRAAVLEALERAAAWQAAERRAGAARARFDASGALATAEKTRVEAQGEGFTEAVLAGNSVVDAARGLREAVVEAARARVRAALAAGWPSPADLHVGATSKAP